MKPGIDPKVDYAFKKLFGSESNTPLLIDLLNAVLNPPLLERIVALEILNPFNDKDALDDKLSILDIKARDSLGRLYNVEMEMSSSLVFPNRVLYYWSVLHSGQLQSGDEYELLRPTISISFVNDVLFPEAPGFHTEFRLRSSSNAALIFSPHVAVHVLELPKFGRSADQLNDALDRWCYFLIHGESLEKDHLPVTLKVPPVESAMEVLQMLSQTQLEWLQYQDRLKATRDHNMRLKDALDKGVEKGQILGCIGQIHLCERLQRTTLTPTEELQRLTLAELQAKVEALERQLGVSEP